MNNLQTPQIFKQVRETLGLSQASVSKETGINRTYLSRFESGVQILSDEHLQSLQDHYVNMGFDFSEIEEEDAVVDYQGRPAVEREGCTIMDGFLLPQDYSLVEAEELLEELKDLEDQIEANLSAPPPEGIVFAVDKYACRDKLRETAFMGLRAFSIVRQLQGKTVPISELCHFKPIDPTGGEETLRDYLCNSGE